MEQKKNLDGKYLIYREKPLVRENNVIIYGDMDDNYVLQLIILSEKEVKGEKIPNNILVQIINTKNKSDIYKQEFKQSMFDAMELGMIWLEKANAQ